MVQFSPQLIGLTPEREFLLNYIEVDKLQLQPKPIPVWQTQPPPRKLLGTYPGFYFEQFGMNGLPSIDFLKRGNITHTETGPYITIDDHVFFLRRAKDHELRSLFAYMQVEDGPEGTMILHNNSFVNEKHYTDSSVQNLIYPWVGNPVKVGWRFDYMVGTDNQNSSAYGRPGNAYFRIPNGADHHDKIVLKPSNRNLWDAVSGICEYDATNPNTMVWLSIYCLPDTGSKNYNSNVLFFPSTKTFQFI